MDPVDKGTWSPKSSTYPNPSHKFTIFLKTGKHPSILAIRSVSPITTVALSPVYAGYA